MSLSEFARKIILGKKVNSKNPPKVNWRTYRELGELKRQAVKAGTNINQIAKQINEAQLSGKPLPNDLELAQEISKLKSILEAVSSELSEAGLLTINANPAESNEG